MADTPPERPAAAPRPTAFRPDPVRPWLSRAVAEEETVSDAPTFLEPAEDVPAEPGSPTPAVAARDPWLTIVGIGDDGLTSLSASAREAIDAADTIFGGARHLSMLDDATTAERIAWETPFANSVEAVMGCAGSPTVILATGDPLWFGVGATLLRHVPFAETKVLPALSAYQLAAARLGWPLQDCRCLTVHGRPIDAVARELFPRQRLLVYSADASSPQALARLLTSRGYGQSRLVVLEHLGGAAERIVEGTAAGFDLEGFADLNTVAIECRAGRAASPRPRVAGLPDDAFVHDGKMTKRVQRALAIACLQPLPGDLLWDVGAGSGSISVEWLRGAEGARAVAIEPIEARTAMITENAAILGVPELAIVAGEAPAAYEGLDSPDAVFIGGGLTDGVFDGAWDALKPGGRMVVHTVTLESEAILLNLNARLGGEIMRLAVERAEKVGPYHGFKPGMPVLHWHVTKPFGRTAG